MIALAPSRSSGEWTRRRRTNKKYVREVACVCVSVGADPHEYSMLTFLCWRGALVVLLLEYPPKISAFFPFICFSHRKKNKQTTNSA